MLSDGDEAGMAFAHKVAGSLPNAKIIPSPEGQDVNSFVMDKGPSALMERLK